MVNGGTTKLNPPSGATSGIATLIGWLIVKPCWSVITSSSTSDGAPACPNTELTASNTPAENITHAKALNMAILQFFPIRGTLTSGELAAFLGQNRTRANASQRCRSDTAFVSELAATKDRSCIPWMHAAAARRRGMN